MEHVNSVANSLWRHSNASSPAKSPSHPLLGPDNHHRGFWSSDAREEAIARGQWELMEMVKNMPESSYELSLKDLVENQETLTFKDDHGPKTRDPHRAAKAKMGSLEEIKRVDHHDRSKGLFLNIVMFPSSLKANSKKKNSSGKVSPNKVDHGEKDWSNKKRFSVSDRRRRGGGIGGGSASSGRERKINGPPIGCWPFLCSRRCKTLR